MRSVACAFLALAASAASGCYLSHELRDGGDDGGDASCGDAGTCTPIPMPDLGFAPPSMVGSCGVRAATAPAPLYAPCFRPCATVSGGDCRETPLAPFFVSSAARAVERDGRVYFGMGRLIPGSSVLIAAMSADGDTLAAFMVVPSFPAGGGVGESYACAPLYAALSDDAWAYTVRNDHLAGGALVGSTTALFFGPLDEPSTWGAPSTAMVHVAGAHLGVVAGDRAALLGPPVWSLDTSGAADVIPAARSGDTATSVVALHDGNPVWLESNGGQTIAAFRERSGAVATLVVREDADVVAFGTDGPAWVWLEAVRSTGELRAYTATIVDDAADLRPRRVADAAETHWGAPVGTFLQAAFGRARIAIVSLLPTGDYRLLVVDDATGLAGSVTLPAARAPLALAFATHDQLDVATVGCSSLDQWVLRLDVRAVIPAAIAPSPSPLRSSASPP